MEHSSIVKAYDRMARGYDFIFGQIFEPARRKVIEKMALQPHKKVLEVGVGTGLSLPLYPKNVEVYGIDISENMLARAKKRVQKHHLQNVHLQVMDAQQLTFADDTFDVVVAMYVASVVPDPARMVAEMKRVCKPNGQIFIVNHFNHPNRFIHLFEKTLSKWTPFLGFTSDFPLEPFLEKAQLSVQAIEPANILGYWTIIHAVNHSSERSAS
jgi:phosphatidylethanolamine/phosphatidyl-N-methylethanolamine N-methyltransferase